MDLKEQIASLGLGKTLVLTKTSDEIYSIVQYLKDQSFNCLIDLFGVDYPNLPLRIEVIYLLLSLSLNKRITIKVKVHQAGFLPSIVPIFPNATWLENETYDMYGVHFKDHPNLQRILTDYGFEGHPMLKDFPLTGYKELRYDLEKKEVVYEAVNLQQEYRNFDFLSPWEEMDYASAMKKINVGPGEK